MRGGMLPCLLDRSEIREEFLELLPTVDWHATIAEVELYTWENNYSCRTERGVLYPVGAFRTTLVGIELANAVSRGYVRKVRSWAEYKLAPLFTKWVDGLWKMRQEYKTTGNRLYDQFAKRMLNGLYGKFAQLSQRWQNVDGDLSALPWQRWTHRNNVTGEQTEYRSFGWQVQKQTDRVEMANTFVAISAFVTSAARHRMNGIRDIIGQRHCFYQGVDGLIVTNEGRQRLDDAGLIRPTELGYLRHELTTDSGTISGVSDYRLGEKVVIAGKPRLHTLSEQQTSLQRRFHAVTHLFDGKAIDTVTEERFQWRKQGEYWKGVETKGGWINPIELEYCHEG